MRTRLWLIILLLAWTGQCAVPNVPAEQQTSARTIGFRPENLAALIAADVRRRALEPRPCSPSRARRQRGGKKPQFQRPRTPMPQEEEQEAQAEQARQVKCESVFDPQRWGLTPEWSEALPERLRDLWTQYAECFKTKTRDTSEYAYHYLSGLLRLECKRNYTSIGRATGIAGENLQHFMSNSPWPSWELLGQVREEIKATPELAQGSMLLLDESADESGEKKAGAGRQYNGRLGKVDMSQVGVFLAYANLTHPDRPLWTWVDGGLYFQEQWFAPAMADLRERVGVPPDLVFETTIEKGWKMLQRAQSQGLPFEAVACDDLYGRSTWLRDQMDGAGMLYMADVPRNTQVYLEKPVLGVPEHKPGRAQARKPRGETNAHTGAQRH